ncbi:hypothetical protein BDY19DRAFT_934311 [Irpex rosettiformis]|uniref:Uncharacterized protein n=1 Tax=Irpex rosettiformis TaxID=378272 RepID=A0ACB8UA93_9APHY|nr:hypothetical protein BDY19DRAFT_934311 [Irpex rosettiformis]
MQRPPLPFEHLNPYVKTLDPAKVPPVKFQEIIRDGQATVVARMKVSTPSNHAFILRRLDTGAISSTTMFRAAFPSATDEAERAEAVWIKSHWNVSGANKQGTARFAGTWVTQDVALELARDYHLSPLIQPLAMAAPDPNIIFRKSGKTLQQPTPVASPVSAAATIPDSPATKRRREASPSATTSRTQAASQPTPRRGATPSRTAATVATPRRSARIQSPAPPTPAPISAAPVTKIVETVEIEPIAHGSDETAVEDDARDLARVAEQNMEEDIREQRELITKLKAEQQAKNEAVVETTNAITQESSAADVEQVVTKRLREEEPTEYTLNIKEPEVSERAIATNKRVQPGKMGPERKSLAWGALAFAVGAGAISLLPSLPNLF